MSVINKMLQDLENRQSGEQPSISPVGEPLMPSAPKRNWLGLTSILSVTILFAVAGYYFWTMQQRLQHFDKILSDKLPTETVHQIKAEHKNAAPQAKEDNLQAVSQQLKLVASDVESSIRESALARHQANRTLEVSAVNNPKLNAALNRREGEQSSDLAQQLLDAGRQALNERVEALAEPTKTQEAFEPNTDEQQASAIETVTSEASVLGANQPKQNKDSNSQSLSSNVLAEAKAPEKPTFSVKTVSVSAEQLANKSFLVGESFKHRGLLQEAIVSYQQALKHWPTHAKSRIQIAALFYARNEIDAALQVLEQGLALETQNTELATVAAKICMKQELFQRGLSYLANLPLQGSADIARVALRANLAQKAKHYEQALADYDQLLRTNPNNARWLLGKAIALDMLSRLPEAAILYKQVLSVGGVSLASRQHAINRLQLLRDKTNG